jgi:hypothetical protein
MQVNNFHRMYSFSIKVHVTLLYHNITVNMLTADKYQSYTDVIFLMSHF